MVFYWQPTLSRAGVMLGASGSHRQPTSPSPFASFSCMAAAKMRAEFNAQIAELRRELLAHRDAMIAEISAAVARSKPNTQKKWATLQRQLADARAELSKHQMLDASQSGNDATRLN